MDTHCGVSDKTQSEYHLFMGRNNDTSPSAPYWARIAKQVMRGQGITQEDLKETLGVETRGAVGHYMTGRRELSLEQFVRLSRRLGLSVSQLIGESPVALDNSKRAEILRPLDSINEADLPMLVAMLQVAAQRSPEEKR